MEQFLQKDLLQGHIYYLHSGDESVQDAFDITLADNHRPPNLSPRYVSTKHTSTTTSTFSSTSTFSFTVSFTVCFSFIIHQASFTFIFSFT